MAIIVEDGTGLTNSVSYASYADMQAYATARGIDLSAAVQTAWEAALVKATDYIEENRFKGQRKSTTQALSFPRTDLYDEEGTEITGVPVKLVQATIEYALRARTSDLHLEPTTDASGLQVASIRKVVGPIEKSVSYSTAQAQTRKTFPVADNKLSAYIVSGGQAVRN